MNSVMAFDVACDYKHRLEVVVDLDFVPVDLLPRWADDEWAA